jgi:aminoglycoside phosphotransferase
MEQRIRGIQWIEISKTAECLADPTISIRAVPLLSGLEAEVIRLDVTGIGLQAVLKVWNRKSKPDIDFQYRLLSTLYAQGLPVSQPLGWGFDREQNPVLLTSFDGSPVRKIDKPFLKTIAGMLIAVHQVKVDQWDESLRRKVDFVRHFFPNLDDHPDLAEPVARLVQHGALKQDRLIHGDYNLLNIMQANGTYTIIDWTNGQLGDPRYDIAWSGLIIKIYASERYGTYYLSQFLAGDQYTRDELERFEAIACLRWILMNRIATLPKDKNTLLRVKRILQNNPCLNENLL